MGVKRGRGGGARRLLVPEVKLPSFEEVDVHGPRPEAPDQLFLVQGSGTHRIRKEQIVSMRMTRVEEEAEQLRSAGGRLPLIINAGTPTDANPTAGQCFREHEFLPMRSDIYESEWRSHGSGGLQLHVSEHQYCSASDALARYAGGEALLPSGHALFIVVFLNEGNPTFLPKPTESSTEEQRQAVLDRDYIRLLQLGANVYYTFKIVSHDRQPPQVMYGKMSVPPMSFDEFQEMMINGGRPIDGNRSKGEN